MSVFSNRASGSESDSRAYVAAVLGLLGDRDPIEVLQGTPAAIRSTLDGLTGEQLATPELADKWSIREVIQHLADAELVWGYRLRKVLTEDRPRLDGYDQDGWADRFDYRHVNTKDALSTFIALRSANLRLMTRMTAADYDRTAIHAERGEESLRHMVRLNAGHDLLHIAQLERIRNKVTPPSSPA